MLIECKPWRVDGYWDIGVIPMSPRVQDVEAPIGENDALTLGSQMLSFGEQGIDIHDFGRVAA